MSERARLEAKTQRTLERLEDCFDRLRAVILARRITPLVLKRLKAEGLLRERVRSEDDVRTLASQAVQREELRRAGRRRR